MDTKPQTSYYRWQDSSGSPTVLIAEAVITEIREHVFTGFKASPRPGTEMGGALLGAVTSDGREIVVDEFEPLQIEHQHGTPYILSENDYAQWRQWLMALRQAFPRLVGICRSHTRPGLRVAPEDNVLIKQFMDGEQGVLLLVKPLSERECVGALYPFSNGTILNGATTSEEFPFGAVTPPIATHEGTGRKGRPWIPITAVIAGMGAAVALHCSSDSSRENPIPRTLLQPAALSVSPSQPKAATVPMAAQYGEVPPPETVPRRRIADDDEASDPPPKPTIKWSVPPPDTPSAGVPAKREAAPPPPVINSLSQKPATKPVALAQASAASEDEDSVRVRARLTPLRQTPPAAVKSQSQGRLRRLVGGFTEKATHLWPFHSDKQEPPIQ